MTLSNPGFVEAQPTSIKLIFFCFAEFNKLFNLASLLNTPSPENESLDKFIIPNIFELSKDNARFQLDNF